VLSWEQEPENTPWDLPPLFTFYRARGKKPSTFFCTNWKNQILSSPHPLLDEERRSGAKM